MFISFKYHLLYYKYTWISNYNQYSLMYSIYPYIIYNTTHAPSPYFYKQQNKMEQIECSETSAYTNQTPGNHPKENK